jgi:hypothetical protein
MRVAAFMLCVALASPASAADDRWFQRMDLMYRACVEGFLERGFTRVDAESSCGCAVKVFNDSISEAEERDQMAMTDAALAAFLRERWMQQRPAIAKACNPN